MPFRLPKARYPPKLPEQCSERTIPFGIDLYDNLVQAYSDLFTEKEKEELYRAVWDGKKELRVDVSGWDIDSKN